MFKRLFGIKGSSAESRISKILQRDIHDLFNTEHGHKVLSWLIKTHLIDTHSTAKASDLERAYINGQQDFLRLLVNLTDFDFVNFMKDEYGH